MFRKIEAYTKAIFFEHSLYPTSVRFHNRNGFWIDKMLREEFLEYFRAKFGAISLVRDDSGDRMLTECFELQFSR